MAAIPDGLQAALGPQYTLEREVGRGGMAIVYVARDTKHRRPVALKLLRVELTQALDTERFRREIAVAASLHHPHILPVLDSGETSDGQLWFTMPFVDGESLRDRLARDGSLPVDDALRIAHQTADALAYAHGRGIIHRDIKPGNILLSGGNALVADFGIARLLVGEDEVPTLTPTGLVIGTPGYMSPEQQSGLRILDARTDVFSLGVVLYEMLVGGLPSIRRDWPQVPEGVDTALRKALEAVADDRWQSAGEFSAALKTAERTGSAIAPPSARAPAQWARVAVLGLAVVIAAAGWFGWSRGHGGPTVSKAALRVAVLPFENVGDSADAYFADGVTDAVRGKLTNVPALEVIGSTSSGQYRHTTKTPQEIGRDLDVRYLLVGKVLWARGPGGASRVRVMPELIDVANATDKWEQPFDAPLTDVFQVQNEIAGEVAEQLEVELTPAAAQALADRPTADLTAYDAYLRGLAMANARGSPTIDKGAAALFTEAVGRDTTFALAWAALARAQARVYAYSVPRPALADSADQNSARAVALAPGLSDAHAARAYYYLQVRKETARALHEDSVALALAPRDAGTLRTIGGAEATLGQWEAGEAHLMDAVRLEPRSVSMNTGLAEVELVRRHYDRARAAIERALTLSPTDLTVISDRLLLSLGQGDLVGGRAFLRSLPSNVDRSAMVAFLGEYGDLGWALDSGDAARLVGLGPDAFDGDRGAWAFALAQQYAFGGDQRRARAYADTARGAFEAQLAEAPGNAQLHAVLGVALAYLGQRDAAVREGQRAVALLPIAQDGFNGGYMQHQLARTYVLVGEQERALDVLEPLLRMPCDLSPGWLRIDPNFAPLRGSPRFERLAAGDAPIS